MTIHRLFIYLLFTFGCVHCNKNNTTESDVELKFSVSSITIDINGKHDLQITTSQPLENSTHFAFTYDIGEVTYINPPTDFITPLDNFTMNAYNTTPMNETVIGQRAGHVVLALISSSQQIVKLNESYVHISVIHSQAINIVSIVIGWLYFVAWSVSFYPQVFLNIKRKSVAGLNFDFLGLNFLGFLFYSLFNVGLYFIPEVKTEYKHLHPRGIIPVEINDIVFALHALLLTIITIAQCFCFKRDAQRVSKVCLAIFALIAVGTIVTVGVRLGHVMNTLDLLYYFSYVKLGITIIKYVPQAWFNYQRQSTEGWSIGNILLDFTGGSLSILQMFLIAYNNDDWTSLFGNPTKFGLGFFSVLFDILFMTQHYCLYRNPTAHNYTEIVSPEDIVNSSSSYGSTVINSDPFVNDSSK